GVFLASVVYVHRRGRVRLPFMRQLFNHSSLLAPYNSLMYLFSAVPSRPLLGEDDFPDLKPLSANWQTIREEALKLADEGYIRKAFNNNDIGFNSFFKRGWKRFYLKWYDQALPSAQALCPKTVALLAGIPTVKGAMFALLDPRSHLNPHRDPFAGSMRYHLGLVTPNADTCFISVDGERYFWKDGEAVLFDETYIHFVENNTDTTRIILLCDIERPLTVRFMRAVNSWVSRKIVTASATQNVENEPVGALNRFYGEFYHPIAAKVSGAARSLKRRSRPLYRTLQYGLVIGLLYLVFA
ncbi:MAG TPA: aspartyl/asparaginyl beta-hydroxylase domain-containing protein, partial [Burkholderiales bacterium]|nr:aspartyl/asparaginyl beta-hydroxylase domain-containing protein [Burkholderiales bacterium]